MINTIQIKENN